MAAAVSLLRPPLCGSRLGDLRSSLRCHARGSRRPALLAHGGGGRVHAPFLWRRLTILDLTGQDIDHQLAQLIRIAGRLGRLGSVGTRIFLQQKI